MSDPNDASFYGLELCPECNGDESWPGCRCGGRGWLVNGRCDPSGVAQAFRKLYAFRSRQMETPKGLGGDLIEGIMARLMGAGVLKPDEPGRPTHYNRAYTEVADAIGHISDPRVDSARPGERAVPKTDLPPELLPVGMVDLAKRQNRRVIPDAWPRIGQGESVIVTASSGRYLMQAWMLNGKQITFRSLGKIEVEE